MPITGPVTSIVEAENAKRKAKGRKPRRFRRPRPQKFPTNIERETRAKYLARLEAVRQLFVERILPRLERLEAQAVVKADRQDVETWSETLSRLFQEVDEESAKGDTSLATTAAATAAGISAFNASQVRGQVSGILDVDIFLAAEPELAGVLAASVTESVGLIKSVESTYLQELEGLIIRGFRSGKGRDELAGEIEKRFAVAKSKAAMIARDQSNKLNGDLTRNRQVRLGIPGYIWRTAKDTNVRDMHADLEGDPQTWGSPPVTNSKGDRNHPGGDFNCRCFAEPDLTQIVG